MNVEGILHHQCPVANCWKCPVCGTICASAASAQKHLDNHNGIKAFVCTICQYKGNTLRGLRTHIRMHFNKRLLPDLMVSYKVPLTNCIRMIGIIVYIMLRSTLNTILSF